MIYYLNDMKSYQKKKCSLFYGDLLDKKILDENELTINYYINPYNSNRNKRKYKYKSVLGNQKNKIPVENTFYTSQRTYLLNPSPK